MAILESLLLEIIFPGPVPLVQKVILMAKMLLHLLDEDTQFNVSRLAEDNSVSRNTLYEWGYRAIAILGLACIPDQPGPKPTAESSIQEQEQNDASTQQMDELRQQNDRLRVENQRLRAQVERLTTELSGLVDKAIVVLRLSGKVSYRGIEECIRLLFGIHVPFYIIKEKLGEAADKAEVVLPRLLGSIRVQLTGLDEVYLKERGRRVYGLLVVDLPSRAILVLKRATDRTADTWQTVIEDIPHVKDSLQGLVSDLARAFPALVRQLSAKWGRPLHHQLCNVHAMRKLYTFVTLAMKPYRQAKQRYNKAKKALAAAADSQEAQTEYWSARQLRNFHWRMSRYVLVLVSQLLTALCKPTRQAAEAALDQALARMAELPADYQPWVTKVTDFIHRHRPKLLTHYDVLGLDWTTNACEGAFSVLRRFVTVYKAFPSQESVEQFFALFVLYYNLKPQRYADGACVAPWARAGVHLEGNYLHYLGYETPQTLIPYSKLAQKGAQKSQMSVLRLSTDLNPLPMAA
jgi:hypothetical protein